MSDWNPNMFELFDKVNRNLGPQPRVLTVEVLGDFARPSRPSWMNSDKEPLNLLWKEHRTLLRHGEVTFGYIYMANSSLFEPGDEDAPAGMLHSFDPYVQRNPEILESIGNELYSNYADGSPLPQGPWFQASHEAVTNDMNRAFGHLLPPTLTQGHAVYLSTPMIHREHLSNSVLEAHLIPILAARDPTTTGTTMILPYDLWPRTMLD